MAEYKLVRGFMTGLIDTVIRTSDNANIPINPQNTDCQTFLEWIGEGNSPDPADD